MNIHELAQTIENSNSLTESQKSALVEFQNDMEIITNYIAENYDFSQENESYSTYNEATLYKGKLANRNLWDADHVKNHAASMAAIAAAKANNDANYKELVKVSRKRKKLIEAINKKYRSLGKKAAKSAFKTASKTSSLASNKAKSKPLNTKMVKGQKVERKK